MGKKSKKIHNITLKNKGGESKAVYKLYKKTGKMVRGGFPKGVKDVVKQARSWAPEGPLDF